MKKRNNLNLKQALQSNAAVHPPLYGCMKGTARVLGDIISPAWDGGPWDAELGIAYRGENGEPVYYTGNGCETTDDLK